jgi:hypothetical protein
MISAPNEEVAQQYALLAELPRPRPVRMSRQGKLNVTIVVITLLLLAGGLIAMSVMQPQSGRKNHAPPPRALVYVLPLGLVSVIALVMQLSVARQRQLLVEGEIAMARVTKQWITRNGYGINYEFTTPAGGAFSRMSTDTARRLLVGMDVPVFYDPQRPKRQVALCASFYEVILPGQH